MFRNLRRLKCAVLSAFLVFLSGAPLLRAQEKSLTAEEIMDRSAKTLWGDKYKGLTSYRYELEMTMGGQGMTAKIVVQGKAPNKMHSVVEVPNVVRQEQGFDGQVAWGKDSMLGLREKEGSELAEAKHDSWFYSDAEWRDHYKKVTLKREDTVNKKRVYVLELEVEGLESRTQTVDAETFLPVSATASTDSPQGKMGIETEYLEYKPLEGAAWGKILMPWKIRQSVAGQTMDIEIKKAECNVDIPDSVFSMPKEEEEEEEGDDSMDDEGGGRKKGDDGKKEGGK